LQELVPRSYLEMKNNGMEHDGKDSNRLVADPKVAV
jgi:hypothetical protein